MVNAAIAPSTQLPAFAFEIGQAVTHRDQPMPSIVLDRMRSSNGLEFYGIVWASDDGDRDLWILGESLVAI